MGPLDCDVQFAYNSDFTTTAAVLEFVIPVFGLTVINGLIYRKITQRIKTAEKLTTPDANSTKKNGISSCKTKSPSNSSVQVDIDGKDRDTTKDNKHLENNKIFKTNIPFLKKIPVSSIHSAEKSKVILNKSCNILEKKSVW